MKRRDLLWMLAPCLLLAGMGWRMQQSEAAGMRLWIRDVQIVAPTPYERAHGYDTRVIITTGAEGVSLPPRPQRIEDLQRRVDYTHRVEAKLFFRKDGVLREAPPPYQPDQKNRAQVTRFLVASPTHQYQDIYRFKQSEWPLLGQPELHIQVWIEKATSVRQTTSARRAVWQKPIIETTDITSRIVPLIPAGKIPGSTSEHSPTFRLRRVTTSWTGSSTWNQPQVQLHLTLTSPMNPVEHPKVTFDYLWLCTERGRFNIGRNYDVQPAPDGKSLVISIPAKGRSIGLSPERHEISLKAQLSLNDGWPQPLTIKVRQAGKNIFAGKNISRPQLVSN